MSPPLTLRHEVRAYLSTLVEDIDRIEDSTDLFSAGGVRSMQVLELVNHLEDTYGLAISQRDLFTGRLRTVAAIAELVAERQLRRAS